MTKKIPYPASLEIDYPDKLDRVTTLFRLLWVIPILFILMLLTTSGDGSFVKETSDEIGRGGTGIMFGLATATLLMIVFRQRYPRWWFDFALELTRFSTRVGAYILLLTDKYPSTVDEQTVHLDVTYPNVKKELSRWLPLFKWLLLLPHYLVFIVLVIGVIFTTVIAWFSIIFTGRYPKGIFDFVVGVNRWSLRINAYAFLLTTDKYPPFSLK